jgi:hypothetical protein
MWLLARSIGVAAKVDAIRLSRGINASLTESDPTRRR